MKNLLIIISLLALTTAFAFADDAADDDGAGVKAEEQDCSKLEGDAKTECEKAETAPPAEEEGKGGKAMKKDNNNRMEAFDEDE